MASLTGDTPVFMLGMDLYSVQFTTLMRAVTQTAIGVVLWIKWRSFTRDEDVEMLEHDEEVRRSLALRRREAKAARKAG